MRPTLDEIALSAPYEAMLWTDKSSRVHDYCKIYDREFSKWRDEPIQLMEIGLNRGASLKMWLEYFTAAHIVGVDIDIGLVTEAVGSDRCEIIQGDQSDLEFWRSFLKGHGRRWDIIIDDGCHYSGPIHVSCQELWPAVAPGGYYVVEDITEVKHDYARTPGFPNHLDFVQNLIEPVIFGKANIEEILISKDLCILRKKA